MRRRFAQCAAVASLAFAAACFAWDFWGPAYVGGEWMLGGAELSVTAWPDEWDVGIRGPEAAKVTGMRWSDSLARCELPGIYITYDGVSWYRDSAFVGRQLLVDMTTWKLGLMVGPIGLMLLLAFIPRRRRPEHACAKCGYDLRASPQRCPECGAAVAPNPVTDPA